MPKPIHATLETRLGTWGLYIIHKTNAQAFAVEWLLVEYMLVETECMVIKAVLVRGEGCPLLQALTCSGVLNSLIR